jgi:hypothetical protein
MKFRGARKAPLKYQEEVSHDEISQFHHAVKSYETAA